MSMIRSFVVTTASLGFAALLAATPAGAQTTPAVAQTKTTETEVDADTGGREGEAGLGVAAGVISVFYAPAKVLYAAGGGLVAGLAYVVSAGDQQIVDPILSPAVRGDYLITPEHLRGERPLEFVGRQPEDGAARDKSEQSASQPAGDGLDTASDVPSDETETIRSAADPK